MSSKESTPDCARQHAKGVQLGDLGTGFPDSELDPFDPIQNFESAMRKEIDINLKPSWNAINER